MTSGSRTRNRSKNSTTDVPKILGRKNSIHTDLPPTKQSCKNNILTNSNYFKKQKHRIFHNHAPLVSYKRDKKVGTFLVISSFKTEEQPDSFKLMQTSAFFHNHAALNFYKRDKTLTTQVLVRSALKTEEQPGSF